MEICRMKKLKIFLLAGWIHNSSSFCFHGYIVIVKHDTHMNPTRSYSSYWGNNLQIVREIRKDFDIFPTAVSETILWF